MNPEDAAARNLKEGETVLVWNDRGKVEIPVYITDRIAAGVVAMSQGAWYRPDQNGIDPGRVCERADVTAPNALCAGECTAYESGGSEGSESEMGAERKILLTMNSYSVTMLSIYTFKA